MVPNFEFYLGKTVNICIRLLKTKCKPNITRFQCEKLKNNIVGRLGGRRQDKRSQKFYLMGQSQRSTTRQAIPIVPGYGYGKTGDPRY